MTIKVSWHLAVDLKRKKMRLQYKILFVTLHILAIPLHMVSVTIFCSYKLIVLLLAKIFRDFAEPIKSSDSVFLADSFWTRPHSSILGGIELDRNVTVEEATKLFSSVYELRDEKGRRCYRELGFCIVRYLGYGFWQPVPDFKLESRIHIWNQKGKGEGTSSPEGNEDGINNVKSLSSATHYEVSFISIVEGLLRQGYGEPDPLWDCYIFHDFNGKKNRCLVLIRFHHIMADGMSFVKFFYSLTGSYQLPDSFTKPGASQKKWDHIADSFWVKVWTTISVVTGGFVEYINALLVAKDRNPIQFGKNGKQKLTGNWMCSMGKQWDLGEMKKASKLHGCSVVHIILAGISGGLERYLKKYHGDEKMPEACHFVVPLPIPGHPNLQLVNKWCISKVRAQMGLEGAKEKLAYFKEETKRCASDSIPLITAFTFQFICGILPTRIVDLGTKAKATSTLIVSNVVGPQGDRRLADANIMDMFFFMPISQESMALSSGVISCNGEVRICLTADIGCVPDRARLEDLGMMMYDEMKEICDGSQGLKVQMTGLQ